MILRAPDSACYNVPVAVMGMSSCRCLHRGLVASMWYATSPKASSGC